MRITLLIWGEMYKHIIIIMIIIYIYKAQNTITEKVSLRTMHTGLSTGLFRMIQENVALARKIFQSSPTRIIFF